MKDRKTKRSRTKGGKPKAQGKGGKGRGRQSRSTRTGGGQGGGARREHVLKLLGGRDGRRGLSTRALLERLGATRREAHALNDLLEVLESEGRVERVGRRFRLTRRDGFVEANLGSNGEATDDRGRSFRVSSDLPLPSAPARVLVAPDSRGGAELIDVLDRERAGWVGLLDKHRGGGVVTPYRDSAQWIVRVAARDCADARDGDVVVVEPVEGPRGRPSARAGGRRPRRARDDRSDGNVPRGRVVESLGPPGAPDADFQAVVWRHRLPTVFPPAVEREAAALPEGLDARELAARLDLRDRPFVTIDPASARDHDDAVWCERIQGSRATRLWVAIADVSHAVAAGGAIDTEALRRGNSVYFPDRAIPMLPERISGDLCSLVPDADRAVVVVEMRVDEDGRIRRPRFHRAVLRSHARLDYARAARCMAGRDDLKELAAGPAVCVSLAALAETAERLRKRRFAEGSIDLELPEVQVVIDEDGKPSDVVLAERTVAHRAIEDAMLAANRVVAAKLTAAKAPAVFRIHEDPAPDEWSALRERLEGWGLLQHRGKAPLSPGALAAALHRAEGPRRAVAGQLMLRAMRQARYHQEDKGHFALGFESYTHFTSPIRRYADLVVHRALLALMGLGPAPAAGRMDAVALRTSYRERLAMEAEREMVALKKCLFMRGRVGEVFDGTVTGTASHGMYVTLEEPRVEGMVPVAALGGRVEWDERSLSLRVRRSGRTFRLGDSVRVRLVGVDVVRTWITLSLMRHESAGDGEDQPSAGGSSSAVSSSARRSHSR